ncbi:CYTH domain-containing protein [Spiribacter halobius]|uniref:Adenylate cyclase n=1 Tax=Sediminicurvatus halobius TaxID=2182432 RepID=A0A2U2N2K5_9GAMM|nr:CYTH domain-containing protein [Spiribacter halobius]PWG63209.1 adenylate cyclase [Spiribacter halobius]UEX76721.1 CYTH domain-containing protein [Spiribacter halobius]
MATEIERKFLVVDDSWRADADGGVRYRQGYLAGSAECSVRVRAAAEGAWLNIKGATLGASRQEFEYPVPLADAAAMLQGLCGERVLEKVRYHVPYAGHVWEVDCFEGANAGLVVAELELAAVDEPFQRPPWAGREVTDQWRYYNARLVSHPYRDWSESERRGDAD